MPQICSNRLTMPGSDLMSQTNCAWAKEYLEGGRAVSEHNRAMISPTRCQFGPSTNAEYSPPLMIKRKCQRRYQHLFQFCSYFHPLDMPREFVALPCGRVVPLITIIEALEPIVRPVLILGRLLRGDHTFYDGPLLSLSAGYTLEG